MGCLYLEIEGQSCLLDDVDQGLMKNRQFDLLDYMTKKRAKQIKTKRFFPIAALPGIFQQITPKKSLETLWPYYRLSMGIGLNTLFSCPNQQCLLYAVSSAESHQFSDAMFLICAVAKQLTMLAPRTPDTALAWACDPRPRLDRGAMLVACGSAVDDD